jgi:muconate cycloisomerase
LRIVELTAIHVCIPLRRTIRHASHTRTDTDNLLVRCVLEDGTEGFGEGVPREYVTGETVNSAIELLAHSNLASQFEHCLDFPHAVKMTERLRLAPVAGDDRECKGNAARCALELAVLDAYGRRFQQPLSAVTRLLAPALYEPHERVRYSGAITSARGMKLRVAALGMRLYGFNQLKLKVGIEGYNDVRRLRQLRRLVGRKMDLRIDANEAWSAETAAARIQELESFGITSVEQPVPHEAVDTLAEVRRAVHTPIMLDESLCSAVDAERAVARKTCDLFNLRLSKCGGFIASLRLAQFARDHGLGYQLGCQVGETAILSAAGRAFASTVGGLRYIEGSYDRHLVRESLCTQDLTFGWGGWAPGLTGPGLGISLGADALRRVTIRKEPLLG